MHWGSLNICECWPPIKQTANLQNDPCVGGLGAVGGEERVWANTS